MTIRDVWMHPEIALPPVKYRIIREKVKEKDKR